jgi:hypothetical protein
VLALQRQLLLFEHGDELLGAAWARFMQMAYSGPSHGIREEMLMHHFVGGLKPESASFMNLASEGSVMYETVAAVRTILGKAIYILHILFKSLDCSIFMYCLIHYIQIASVLAQI